MFKSHENINEANIVFTVLHLHPGQLAYNGWTI